MSQIFLQGDVSDVVALEAVAVILAAATDVATSSAVIAAAAAEVAHTLKVTAVKAFPSADVVLPADDVAAVMALATKVTAALVAAVVPVIPASAVV